jgi:hypothetical protein
MRTKQGLSLADPDVRKKISREAAKSLRNIERDCFKKPFAPSRLRVKIFSALPVPEQKNAQSYWGVYQTIKLSCFLFPA